MIASMERTRIAGPKSAAARLLALLFAHRVFHVTPSASDQLLKEASFEHGVLPAGEESNLKLAESLINLMAEAVTYLPPQEPREPAPVFQHESQWLAYASGKSVMEVLEEVPKTAQKLESLVAEQKEANAYRELFEEFQPLLEKASAFRGMEITGVTLTAGYEDMFNEMRLTMEEITGGACAIFRGKANGEGSSALLIYPESIGEEVRRRAFGHKVQPVRLPEKYEKGTFATTLKYLYTRERELEKERREASARLVELSTRWLEPIKAAERGLRQYAELLRSQGHLATSGMTFWISGWVPTDEMPRLKDAVAREFGGAVALYSARPGLAEFPETPVKLENRSWARPFERLIHLYATPMYGGVDPSALIAFTMPMLFGFMLGDVGYALLLAAVGTGLRWKFAEDSLALDMSKIIYLCAAQSALFGLLFCEIFGAAHLWPPLLDRKHEVVFTLMLVLAAGGMHLALGSLIGFFAERRLKRSRHALERLADFGFIVSALLAGFSAITGGPKWTYFLPLVPLAVRVAAVGLSEGLLEAPRIISNMLSYARLMALGLASVIMADVAGEINKTIEWAVAGALAAALIHGVNFVMGVFSPAIQAIRLHYVEFFSRFYTSGGVAYSPLGRP
ncbi:MAG: hypothetical protein HY751_07890 [Nitrospinae bacterium]|nr:hypothetical protein [Nitrospinota bacterium]